MQDRMMEEGMSCRVKEVRGVAVNGVEGREANAKQGGSVELVQVWRATKRMGTGEACRDGG